MGSSNFFSGVWESGSGPRVRGGVLWPLVVLVFPLLFPAVLFAQESFRLDIVPVDKPVAFLRQHLDLPGSFADSIAVENAIAEIFQQLHTQSYLTASVDSVDWSSGRATIWLYVGEQWQLAGLYPGHPEDPIWEQVPLKWKQYRDRPLRPEQLERIKERVLSSAEDQGYPFARVRLDSIALRGAGLRAGLFVEKGPFVVWKDVAVSGDVRIKPAFLRAYLGIRPGSPYSRKRMERSASRLRELAFLSLLEEPSVLFAGGEAQLNLRLTKRRASRFDFLIGLLPNSAQTGKLIITGDFEGEFMNPFGLGTHIYAQFEQLRPQTQQLQLATNIPYLLELPLGVDFDFQLYKRDTTFLDLDLGFGLQWLFGGGDYLSTFWNLRSSSLLSVNENRLEDIGSLPDTLDYRTNSFGLEYAADRLDYRFNPRRGWRVLIRGGAGFKQVRRNPRILETDLGSQYDSIPLRSVQLRATAELGYFVPVFRRSTLLFGFKGGTLLADNPVYVNEQFRIGGTQVLRGFDQQQFFVTHYAVGTLEYRLLIDVNSYLFTFFDGGWISSVTTQTDRQDIPLGFGAGLALDTKVGVFGLSLAFGRQSGQPVDFGAPKLHVGYVSRF